MKVTKARPTWSNRVGFILAAAGSAVGLGNIWKFPYITGNNGGGIFVLVYLLCIILIGIPVLIAELYIGQKGRANTVISYENVYKKKTLWRFAGWLGLISAFLILTFYSVIGGWILDFELKSFLGQFGQKSDAEIKAILTDLFANPFRQVVLLALFVLLQGGIVLGGVKAGIEKWNKILMPGLVIILIGLFFYSLTLDGFGQAIRFLFSFDVTHLSWSGVLEAVGHSFFTLSVGVGVMITYGSYLKPGENIARMAYSVAVIDTIFALLAGIVVFSAVFSFAIEPGSGPTLIFQTLPVLFGKMPGGYFISIAFFILIAFTAITSGMSIYEVVVTYCVETFAWERKKTTILVGVAVFLVGILSALSTNLLSEFKILNLTFFDFFDHLTSKYFLPLAGLMTALFFGWVLGYPAVRDIGERSPVKALVPLLIVCSRFISPVAIFVILVMSILGKL